jgi:hypothetical protein
MLNKSSFVGSTESPSERKRRLWADIQNHPEHAKLCQMFRGQIADLLWKGETLSGKPWTPMTTAKLSAEGLAELIRVSAKVGVSTGRRAK